MQFNSKKESVEKKMNLTKKISYIAELIEPFEWLILVIFTFLFFFFNGASIFTRLVISFYF